MKLFYIDPVLGNINITVNTRARNIIMRVQPDGVRVTIPPYTAENTLHETLLKFQNKLLTQQKALRQQPTIGGNSKIIDLDFSIRTELLSLTFEEGNRPDFYSKGKPGEATIVCPPQTQFNDENLQAWLRKVIEETLRKQALWLIPSRLKELSEKHNLPYNSIKINVSKGRWGSCSTQRNINISCYLVTVPPHLIDYVLLHELSHTIEMNHGPQFWALMDKLTNRQSQALRKELQGYKTGI